MLIAYQATQSGCRMLNQFIESHVTRTWPTVANYRLSVVPTMITFLVEYSKVNPFLENSLVLKKK